MARGTLDRAARRLGETLGSRYALLRVVGAGGMASVFEGVHRNGHAVAIKILHQALARDPEIERLFRREALLANKVAHPGVVPVIDDDVTEDGCAFLVMPFLRGETLRARAKRHQGRKLDVAEVLVVGYALLDALAAAHAKKIIHRDIKPENIFLTTAGEVKVLDFGIGRLLKTRTGAPTITKKGLVVGTPAFMAPEQALGRTDEVDARSDVWAAGATMFTLLTGGFVHAGASQAEVALLACTRPARLLREVAPRIPAPVAAVIDRALAFDRQARWRDAGEMSRALLEACVVSLGVRIAELPRPTAPDDDPSQDAHSQTTRGPSAAPTVEETSPTVSDRACDGGPSDAPTPNDGMSRSTPPPAPRPSRQRWHVALAGLVFVAGLVMFGGLRLRPAECDSEGDVTKRDLRTVDRRAPAALPDVRLDVWLEADAGLPDAGADASPPMEP